MTAKDKKLNVNKEQVGERIRMIRLNEGQNQDDFGAMLGASKGNVSSWESGNFLPRIDRLKKIADIGKVTVENLLYGS